MTTFGNDTITISRTEYDELKHKAASYDRISEAGKRGGSRTMASLTPEQRSARAKKAVEARIKKYGQKSRKTS